MGATLKLSNAAVGMQVAPTAADARLPPTSETDLLMVRVWTAGTYPHRRTRTVGVGAIGAKAVARTGTVSTTWTHTRIVHIGLL
jgi:hypothetical protein